MSGISGGINGIGPTPTAFSSGVDPSAALSGMSSIDPRELAQIGSINDPTAKAEAAAHQLETVFMGMMMKAMRSTVPDGGVLGKGLGGANYVDMLDQQWAALAASPDPRFHETLVKQIMQKPENGPSAVMDALGK